ncbi:MAG: hypothetical protein AAFX81_18735 [Pseudomonadota bacterium]
MSSRIHSVDAVDLALQKSLLPNLLVAATGRAATTGWTVPRLAPFVYVTPPADGILDCDFVATPPADGSVVLPVLTPVAANLVIPEVDLANHWGPGLPLVGLRVHAAANAKVALVGTDAAGMERMRALAAAGQAPTFEADIRPLFRERDALVMKSISGWDLHVYEDVVANADLILQRIEDGTMPCDGAWPQSDIERLRAWIAAGKPA